MLTTLPRWQREGDEAPAWWNSKNDPPKIYDRVRITLNGWNEEGDYRRMGDIEAEVCGYKVTAGWLMVFVWPDSRPAWFLKDNPHNQPCLFAGIELEPL